MPSRVVELLQGPYNGRNALPIPEEHREEEKLRREKDSQRGYTRRGYSQRVLCNMQTRLLFDVGGSGREDEIDVQAFMHGR